MFEQSFEKLWGPNLEGKYLGLAGLVEARNGFSTGTFKSPNQVFHHDIPCTTP